MNFKDIIRVSCALGALSAVTPALAQEPAAGIGDVVVTASKRATNVQDTPIAITAVGQDALVRQGVNQIQDITRVAPEISVQQTGAFIVPQIRGLRTGQFGPTADSPNAIYVDGNYLPRLGGLNGFFYDLERIEVLAGPQGTLFGRNSVGGALNIITRKPELGKFGGNVTADIGNFNQQIFTAAVNIPLTDDLSIRIAGMTNKRDGYFTDTNSGSVSMQGYRFSARWQPTEADTITVSADYEVDKPGLGATNTITRVLRNPTIASSTVAATLGQTRVVNFGAACNPAIETCAVVPINATDDIWHNRVVTANDYATFQTENDGYSVQWDHDFGFATLTGQYSNRSLDQYNPQGGIANGQQDARLKAANVLAGVANGSPGIRLFAPLSNFDGQEIRLTSNSADDAQFKYTVGVNRFHEKTENEDIQYASWYSNNSAARPGTVIGAVNIPTGPGGLLINTGGGQSQFGNVTTDALSVFGEGTYTPSGWSALHITLGARYNWDTKHAIAETHTQSTVGTNYNYFPYPAGGQVVCPVGTPIPACPKVVVRFTAYDEEKDWERATYKANVQYDLTESNNVYATYSTGYVSGGYAPGVPQANLTGNDHSYNPMTIEAMEIGSKNRFFDNRIQFNFSVYHYDFANYLANINYRNPTPQTPPTYFSTFGGAVNAADTEFEGATFDFEALITENDRFHINGQYTEGSIEFKLTDVFKNTTRALLQTNNLETTDACVNQALVGSADGTRRSGANAVVCPLLAAFLGGPGNPPVTNAPLFLGSTLAEFDASGPFERPKWTLNADYTHTFALPNASLDAQVAWHYISRGVAGNGLIAPPTAVRDKIIPAGATDVFDLTSRIPEKSTWDLSFRYQREDTDWSITAYVRNVLDDENLNARAIQSNLQGVASWNLDTLQAFNAGGTSAGTPAYVYITEAYDPPRTFGVQFQANF